MKQPIDASVWSYAANLKWFDGKNFENIINISDTKSKNQLKHNVLKLVVEANKLFHDKVDAWQYIHPQRSSFGLFFKAAIRLALSQQQDFELDFRDRYQLLTFFNYTFNSIEVDYVHEQVRRYLPMSIWINLSEARRNTELSKLPKRIRLAWNKLEEQDKKMSPGLLLERTFERTFIFNYLKQSLDFLRLVVRDCMEDDEKDSEPRQTIQGDIALYCQRFVEFVIDLESQLPLRRFFHAILGYTNFIVRCQMSKFARHLTPEGQLFNQLVDLLQLYSKYEVDNISGEALSDIDVQRKHEQKITSLQKLFWTKYKHLSKYAIKPVTAVDNRSALYNIITSFDNKEELYEFLKSVNLADDESMDLQDRDNPSFMASILINHFKRHESQTSKLNSIPLFPNESVIWDTNLVPDQYYDFEYPLALPKLNLQFLTMSDYLLRNFLLFKYESTYEIRQDIEDGILRSRIRWTSDGHFATGPKQRQALIIKHFSVIEVGGSKLGQRCPSIVKAKVVINMDYVRPEWRREWEQLRKHDTAFLVSFRKETESDALNWPENTFPFKNLVKYVRGCEIEGLLDAEGIIIDEYNETPKFNDNLRTFLVKLDCNQYEIDQKLLIQNNTIIYDKFHLMIRRKPEKNNFKGVLETIRSLMNTKFVVPDWLEDLLIGFGDPCRANPCNLVDQSEPITLDFFDTFLSYEHLVEVFRIMKPDHKITLAERPETTIVKPPFKIRFDEKAKEILVISYQIPPQGPYPQVAPKTNSIKFTPAQVDAITSGLQKGLTMVVGPPGTGKTDVAVQILSSLYHSNPDQRTLIVTHSNQALNQIFSKMIELDVEGHHLLRMGHGEGDLDSTQDFSRAGRVRHVLKTRLEMLALANRLAKSLGLENNQGLSCQSSEYFYLYHIEPRWNGYKNLLSSDQVTCEEVSEKFPFAQFFQDAPQPLFKHQSVEEDTEIALNCFRYIKRIFNLLHEFRPFEIFNNASDRSQYLLIREAKIIAMTCTHAGLRRKDLVEMNFQYDNILMEETAQILEIETTIPLLLQNPENGVNRLKRWIMIGDHNQLPPIIQNSAFQKFSNMEQSLFARFVRLGVPNIELDAQGRARSGLCDLYRWRYKNLQDLPIIKEDADFSYANAGFEYEHQLINVEDYKGFGESAPSPYFYQNRGEAEYIIKLYKFMRMIGYPADKITILTTYNGQKQLLRELLEQECSTATYLKQPSHVTTVDKFQGQQNDYILLSLVRTRTIGHIRDIRRLVVAMSRARLGLYVFGRISLFAKSIELQPALKILRERPDKLHIITNETYPTRRLITNKVDSNDVIVINGLEQFDPEKLSGLSSISG